MESKIEKEIRCVGKNSVKFIPENLVKKPGYLLKHGLIAEDLGETSEILKLHKSTAEPLNNEEKARQDEEILKKEIEAEEKAKADTEKDKPKTTNK